MQNSTHQDVPAAHDPATLCNPLGPYKGHSSWLKSSEIGRILLLLTLSGQSLSWMPVNSLHCSNFTSSGRHLWHYMRISEVFESARKEFISKNLVLPQHSSDIVPGASCKVSLGLPYLLLEGQLSFPGPILMALCSPVLAWSTCMIVSSWHGNWSPIRWSSDRASINRWPSQP